MHSTVDLMYGHLAKRCTFSQFITCAVLHIWSIVLCIWRNEQIIKMRLTNDSAVIKGERNMIWINIIIIYVAGRSQQLYADNGVFWFAIICEDVQYINVPMCWKTILCWPNSDCKYHISQLRYLRRTHFYIDCISPSLFMYITHIHMMFYGPFPRYTLVSQCSHKGETYWNNYWIFVSKLSFLLPPPHPPLGLIWTVMLVWTLEDGEY